MKKLIGVLMIGALIMFSFAKTGEADKKKKSEIDEKYTWDLTDVYETDKAWEENFNEISKRIKDLKKYKGKLDQSGETLLECLELQSELSKEYSRLYSYASMRYDQDTRVSKSQAMKQKMSQLGTDFSTTTSYIDPEILKISKDKIERFLREVKDLEKYEFYLKDLVRQKEHYRDAEEEEIIANASLISGGPSSVHGIFTNADFPYPTIELHDGEEAYLDAAGYSKYRDVPHRGDRKEVFNAFFGSLNKYRRTLGTLLNSQVKKDYFYTKVRNYESCLERALSANNIPVEVYHKLIDNVHDNLDTFHRYLELRRELMGLDTLKYYDLYAPITEKLDVSYEYDEAKKMILDALEPMGEKYRTRVKKAFENRWIDVYPSKGKRSGAYSNGSIYDVHPYILLNYNKSYGDVSTVIHELGHAMHSYYSNENQPYPTSDYAIFVAEVASTMNEILLFHHYYESLEDDQKKLSTLVNYLEGIRQTVFRQTQFAEFELRIHEMVEKGIPLTGDKLNETYDEIVKKYYGHDKNVCRIPDYIKAEWAYIPHFYYNFYVYQYSTSYTAATALSKKIMEGDKEAVDRYTKFISAGGSDYPINILKEAGADLTTSDPFELTMKEMNWTMDQIEKIRSK